MFIDMDSYFASVEQTYCRALQGRPVGVVPLKTDSTCIIAASYDAKRCGVKVGTGVREARKLCPGIALVKARPESYTRVHHRILQSVDRCAEVHKVYSIDEWSIALKGKDREPQQAMELAKRIKQQILQDFGPYLTCSVGIAPTRLLAKMASDLGKPDGLTVLSIDEMPRKMEHIDLKGLCGIGAGMLQRLHQHGIRNVRDLWKIDQKKAVEIWGSVNGARWWAGFHGIDEPEPSTHRRSMTHGSVLDPRFRNEEGARSILIRLVCKLGFRLRQSHYYGRSLTLSLLSQSGRRFSAEVRFTYLQDTPTLLWQFHRLWEQRPEDFAPIKKVDVTVGGLTPGYRVPRSLFSEPEKLDRISQTLDMINDQVRKGSVYLAQLHEYRHPMENKIAFGRIPDEMDYPVS